MLDFLISSLSDVFICMPHTYVEQFSLPFFPMCFLPLCVLDDCIMKNGQKFVSRFIFFAMLFVCLEACSNTCFSLSG